MKKTANTFKLKRATGKILTYKVDGRPRRMYDNRMTEEFAVAFLTYGSEEEIAKRKELFEILPEAIGTEKKAEAVNFKKMNKDALMAHAAGLGLALDKAMSNAKMVEAIEAHQVKEDEDGEDGSGDDTGSEDDADTGSSEDEGADGEGGQA